MNKISKQKLLLATILFAILLISSACTFLPTTHAATVLNNEDKVVSILSSVLGINTNNYSTKPSTQNSQKDPFTDLTEDKVDFTLISNESSIRVNSLYKKGTLNLIFLTDQTGTFALTKPANETANLAKNFLVNYQSYSDDSFYGMLASTLDNVSGSANVTKTAQDVTLRVFNYKQASVDYIWTYTDANGVAAGAKNVILSYDHGRLSCFLNNWPLYRIADVKPEITREKAVAIASETAQNFTYQTKIANVTSTVSVAGFHLAPESLTGMSLVYTNNANQSRARNADPYTLYPLWSIPLGFEKAYPGDVTGVAVRVWADTGEVSNIDTMTYDGAFSQSNEFAIDNQNLSQGSTVFSATLAIGTITSLGILFLFRRNISKFAGKKLFTPKLLGSLLCLAIISGFTISTVNAVPVTSSRIYAAMGGGWYNDTYSPQQSSNEIYAAQELCGQIYQYFDAYEQFNASEEIEADTTKEQVTIDAKYDEDHYDSAYVFHFGHLADPSNYTDPGYVDNIGVWITPEDISSQTQAERHRFVFIWSCSQAVSGASSGMVQAWTKAVSSSEGINAPDTSGKCFIGFQGTSPEIARDYAFAYSDQTPYYDQQAPLKEFIDNFYYDTIVCGYTVAQALNYASLDVLSCTFTSSPLYGGYKTWSTVGPNGSNYYDCRVYVCGNANIHLVTPYKHTLSISSSSGGYTTPTGSQQYWEYTVPYIYAYNDQGYGFSGWYFDSSFEGTNPTTWVYMGDDHTLYAEFTQYQPYHSLSVEGWCWSQWCEVYPEVWIDSNYVGTAPLTVNGLTNDYHTVQVSIPEYPPNMQFSYMDYEGGTLNNPDSFLLNGDYHLTAYYYI